MIDNFSIWNTRVPNSNFKKKEVQTYDEIRTVGDVIGLFG